MNFDELKYIDPYKYDDLMEEAYQYEQDLLHESDLEDKLKEQESNDCE